MSRESFLRRGESKGLTPSHYRSKRQEKEIARRTRGRLTPGSGSKAVKGDVRVKRICRIECKTTKHSSFSVTMDMLNKIEEAALAADELPILVVEFNDGRGKKLKEVAIVPTYILDRLT
jgi:hypothetical protein